MWKSVVLIMARLFLIYFFAMYHSAVYFTLNHVIAEESTGCLAMDVGNIVRYINRAIIGIFMLKRNSFTAKEEPQQLFIFG